MRHRPPRSKFGYELFVEQTSNYLRGCLAERAEEAEFSDETWGDSPIEKLFFFAVREYAVVILGATIVKCENDPQVDNGDPDKIWIRRQVEIEDVGRVDFVIHAYCHRASQFLGLREGWRKLVIECDGHDFHERTKEQAARDRSRDRTLQLKGLDFFRFTGSELWTNPFGAADQVGEWIQAGW